jgi:CBS domain-containing protein
MKVKNVMSQDVKLVAPNDTVETAAGLMAQLDVGVLPVGENDRLVGIVTDRDITIRAAAIGKSPTETTVREVMSRRVRYVFEDESTQDAARKMADLQVRRLLVLNRDKRLVGIVSLGDLAVKEGGKPMAHAIRNVSQPAETHAH